MSISASDVKELRSITGAPMMDCKKALVACDGDLDKAVAHIQASKSASAAKKADRQTYEGQVVVVNEEGYHALIEVNSETDFVSGGNDFQSFCSQLKQVAQSQKSSDVDSLLSASLLDSDLSVEDARQALVAKVGENIRISRVKVLNKGVFFYSYAHTNGKIAALVSFDNDQPHVGKDIAMQVVATGPLTLALNDLNDEHKSKIAESLEEGESLDIHLKEAALLEQDFIKNPDKTVREYLQDSQATIVEFVRLEVGENVVKDEVDFASEVYSQINGDA